MSTSTTTHSRNRYGEGRNALLDAAVRVVADGGLRRLTYRAVAREAGVGHTLVSHHFGTMDALIEAAVERSLTLSVDSVTSRPGSGDLDALFEGLASLATEKASGEAFQFEVILESRRRPELQRHVKVIYEAYIEAIHNELVLAGIHPDRAFTHLVYVAAEGLVFNQITHGSADETEHSLAHLRVLLDYARLT
ncbi:TetR/AcrR family transcriptional regulator [Gordonia polyisoprenivorans]|uniref:TetR/AcrR family transcriptional regulator n=1 Tax=Gordonia polyisoprenivorans TaxID=84595 RepID=UPI00037C1128|nr:TetR family transcriptional regulator [Gordonia polyisoprenivorans]